MNPSTSLFPLLLFFASHSRVVCSDDAPLSDCVSPQTTQADAPENAEEENGQDLEKLKKELKDMAKRARETIGKMADLSGKMRTREPLDAKEMAWKAYGVALEAKNKVKKGQPLSKQELEKVEEAMKKMEEAVEKAKIKRAETKQPGCFGCCRRKQK